VLAVKVADRVKVVIAGDSGLFSSSDLSGFRGFGGFRGRCAVIDLQSEEMYVVIGLQFRLHFELKLLSFKNEFISGSLLICFQISSHVQIGSSGLIIIV
jgi:hypothetical protein